MAVIPAAITNAQPVVRTRRPYSSNSSPSVPSIVTSRLGCLNGLGGLGSGSRRRSRRYRLNDWRPYRHSERIMPTQKPAAASSGMPTGPRRSASTVRADPSLRLRMPNANPTIEIQNATKQTRSVHFDSRRSLSSLRSTHVRDGGDRTSCSGRSSCCPGRFSPSPASTTRPSRPLPTASARVGYGVRSLIRNTLLGATAGHTLGPSSPARRTERRTALSADPSRFEWSAQGTPARSCTSRLVTGVYEVPRRGRLVGQLRRQNQSASVGKTLLSPQR
jgi:hypothetical protein